MSGYPNRQCSSGMKSKFMPYTPATMVGTEMRPAYAVILRMSLFCRSVIFASTASTSVVSSSSKPVTPLGDGGEVVIDVAEVRAHLVRHQRGVALGELAQ